MNKLLASLGMLSLFTGACSSVPSDPKPTAANEAKAIEVKIGTDPRKPAKIYVPANYGAAELKNKKWPLVVLLHGYTATGDQQNTYLGLSARVSSRGFLLAVPEGTASSQGKQFWNATEFCCNFEHAPVDDQKYLLTLIERLQHDYRVDAARIYIFGHSNGGFMANRMACNASETIAGIAVIAGSTFLDPKECQPKEPVSVLHVHATDDPLVKYNGTRDYPGAEAVVARWAKIDGCEASAPGKDLDLVQSIPGIDTTTTQWSSCKKTTHVELWSIGDFRSPRNYSHIPRFQAKFTDLVLDFLFAQKK